MIVIGDTMAGKQSWIAFRSGMRAAHEGVRFVEELKENWHAIVVETRAGRLLVSRLVQLFEGSYQAVLRYDNGAQLYFPELW